MTWLVAQTATAMDTVQQVAAVIASVVTVAVVPLAVMLIKAWRDKRVDDAQAKDKDRQDRDNILKFVQDRLREKDTAHAAQITKVVEEHSSVVTRVAQEFRATVLYEREQCKEQNESILGRLDEVSKAVTASQVASERQSEALRTALAEHRRAR